MFWGLFLVLLGGLILLDRWDIFQGGLAAKLIVSGLIAWGGSILLNCYRRSARTEKPCVGEAEIESTSSAANSSN